MAAARRWQLGGSCRSAAAVAAAAVPALQQCNGNGCGDGSLAAADWQRRGGGSLMSATAARQQWQRLQK